MTLADPVFLADRLAHWAEAKPDETAVTYLGRSWTWAQWYDRVRRLAGALQGTGDRARRRGVVPRQEPPGLRRADLRRSLVGAANAIVNFRLAGDEVDYAVNDAGARMLLVGRELMPLVDKLRDRLPSVERVIEVTPDGARRRRVRSAARRRDSGRPRPRGEPDDVVLVMYSSGTTGHPKGVMLSQANMLAHTVNAHDGWVFEDGDINLVAMPLFHVGGSSYVLFGVHDGIPSLMTRDPDGASLAGAIMAGANRTFLVPAVLAQVLQRGEQAVAVFGRLQDLHLRRVPDAAAAAAGGDGGLAGTDFIQVYGLTEVGGVATHLMPEAHRDAEHPERLVSAGQPIPGMELKIVDPVTLDEVPAGETRRDLAAHAAADEGLPGQARGDGRGGRRPTAGSAPATWARSTTRGSSSSRTGSRT